MSTTGDLFDWIPPLSSEPRAHHGVETSEAAARSMKACSGPMQMKIARYIAAHANANYDEIVEGLSMEKPTVAGRLNDLSTAGFIEPCAVRPTRSGRPAKVYRLTEQGEQLIKVRHER